MEVDGIESFQEAYGNAGPSCVRHMYDIIDDERTHKATYHYMADFVLDEKYYLQHGYIRDVRTKSYYGVLISDMEESWMESVTGARKDYHRYIAKLNNKLKANPKSRKVKVRVGPKNK